MAENHSQAIPAGLHFVATPIGNARDITLRALDILRDAEVLVAEDTRSLRRLMEIHGVSVGNRKILAYHDHSGTGIRDKIIAMIKEGRSVAYASEAGTPLISDPGYSLGRDAIAADVFVSTAPGASAALAALTVSGLPSDRFVFAGFAPTAKSARSTFLAEFTDFPATLILYESPRRIGALLAAAADVLGGDRNAAVCRELTKRFEETRRGTLAELAEIFADLTPKGEIVVCIAKGTKEVSESDIEEALVEALRKMKLKAAAAEVSQRLGVSKRDVYQLGLRLAAD